MTGVALPPGTTGRDEVPTPEAMIAATGLDSAGIVTTASGRHFDRGAGKIAAGLFEREEEVFGASGAAGFYRRAALEDAGGFNESLLACEDVELSWRVIARGYRLGYVSDASATHYEGRSWLRFATKGFRYGRGAAQVESLPR